MTSTDMHGFNFRSHQVWLKPHNFFIENPAIDVPPPRLRKHEF